MKLKIILAALLLMVAGLQTAQAQKIKLYFTDDSFLEYRVSDLKYIECSEEDVVEHEYVDLGLPSGTLWATCNVGASSPEDYGDYFAWGETQPKDDCSWSTYKYCNGSYNTLTKYCTSSSYGTFDNKKELETADDAAAANWGREWQMPSRKQCEELINSDYTTTKWTTQGGVNGYKITSNSNGKSIFLPAAGFRDGTNLSLVGSYGLYWSRSLSSSYSDDAYYLYFGLSNIGMYDYDRNGGQSVRPVRRQEPKKEHEYVDLGLPSGTLWATTNVGANNPEDYGDYFAWGETIGNNDGKTDFSWSTYKWCNGSENTLTKYCQQSDYGYNGFTDTLTELLPEDDAATINWGSEWQMPSKKQSEELCNEEYTTVTWKTVNGVAGMEVKSKINGNSIFLPAAGYQHKSSVEWAGTFGFFWSRTKATYYDGYYMDIFSSGSSSGIETYHGSRDKGHSVRPVRVQEKKKHEYVDLGLPSGTLWATTNVGADSPEDYGDHFAWGETEPKSNSYSWSTYKWCNGSEYELTKYCQRSDLGYNGFTDNKLELLPEDDAATVNWGSEWQMPSKEQCEELFNSDYTTTTWTTRNGVYGRKITSKSNGNTIFLPAAGWHIDTSLINVGSLGSYWSRSLSSSYSSYASGLCYDSDNPIGTYDCDRYYGQSVRPVRKQEPKHEYVDLDLPSGTLWATCNIGASKPEEYGDYFAWGETEPKEKYDSNYKYYSEGLGFTKYCTDSGYGTVDNKTELLPEDDAATANWGSKWQMPSFAQLGELIDEAYTTTEWITQNGVNGYKITSKSNGNSIFLPAAGYRHNTSLDGVGSLGKYWSRSLRDSGGANLLYFNSSDYIGMGNSTRIQGESVRPVRVQN